MTLLAFLITTPAAAQSSALTLREALAMAREHSPALPAASGRVTTAVGSARQLSAPPNPVVELRREHFKSPLAKDDYATVTIPVDVTFRRSALRAAGRGEVAAALADSAATARELDAAVTSAYLRSALANELASIAADRARALAGMADFEAARFAEGAVAEGVALRTRLESDRSKLELAAARAEAERARASLASAMGVAPIDGAALAALPLGPKPDSHLAALDATLDAAVTLAMERRPEVAAAERRVAAARGMVTAEWRATLPDVGVQLGTKRTGGYDTGVAAISIGLPIFDQGSGARQRARGEQQVAEAELRSVHDRVFAEAAGSLRAYREVVSARPPGTVALVQAGAQVARIAEASYREGAITLTELLDAERAHADFRAALARWSAEVALTRMQLNRALGAPIEEGL
jgi:outer membrane protein TolC